MKASPSAASSATPHVDVALELQHAYDFFNRELFDAELPVCMITLQREKDTFGYFSAKRFGNSDGKHTDEIALNPGYFAVVPILEILQTLVHEMTHLWQHHYGEPGRGRYHNAEWANKMEAIGLMPSDTGKPGGKRTGDRIADYAMPSGRFLEAAKKLLTAEFRISWYDRYPPTGVCLAAESLESSALSVELGLPTSVVDSSPAVHADVGVRVAEQVSTASGVKGPDNRSNRLKYSCACKPAVNFWGKPGIKALCEVCRHPFVIPGAYGGRQHQHDVAEQDHLS
ncbi:SprT-like domain-containing protein [Aquabacterium sp. NJ1]|uniref:SprT-like domain-containing protein n=1 Tax=Aquabacterium sp. NJ1 TaxID=1538295 RepID=UPI0006893323|nr:SprT-like domain-containing protein [Aquabacterium sp. NJ1]